ncbi:heme biosynthesis protein HemY [Roseicitreum antarcticum]|uniref:HemY protein n=1 Tax=Roseicitreum antarcticum TaxID=564137 RepID=A0A1H2RMZ1_9RHOB|nr:heme biosynthesis HemY N-terminal domain-containing protein [Roseicitreum antarcticum]SDW20826.1 HemY protein [Roseicitreum antarcticum]
MFWTLLKVVIFIAVVAGLAIGASALLDSGQGVRLAIADIEFVLGPIQSVIAAVAALVALWLILKLVGLSVALLRFLNGDETALTRFFARSREKRGLDALSEGWIALAAQDGKRAVIKANKAEKLLNRPDLTNLLIAQAAELKGNREKAKEYYKLLVSDDRTRFVGIQGLMRQKLEDGDRDTAMKLAQKALSLKPGDVAMQDMLLKLQHDCTDWSGARHTLLTKTKHGNLPKDVYKRRDAVLALQQSIAAEAAGNTAAARDAAIEANALAPHLVPAAARAARMLHEYGKHRAAVNALKKAWTQTPHPDLAAAFAGLAHDETPTARLRRFDKLLSIKPDHPETRMLKAELLIAAEDFPAARRALGDLATSKPTTRSLTIMAAIERGEGSDDAVVRGWLTSALTAGRGPQWVCTSCHHIQATWSAICENCGAFDTLEWTETTDTASVSATQTAMLPLIVGALSKPDSSEADAEDDAILDAEPVTSDARA